MPPEIVTPPVVPDDEFAGAFDLISEAANKAAGGEDKAAGQIEADSVKTPEELAAEVETKRVADEAAKKVADDAAALEAANAGKTPEQIAEETEAARVAEETRVAEEAAKKTAQPVEDDLVARLAKVLKKDENADAAAEEAERVRQAELTARRTAIPQMSVEDLGVLTAFEKEFPEVAKAQTVLMKQGLTVATKHIFNQVEAYYAEKYKTDVEPFIEVVRNLAGRTHLGDLVTAVPDYAKVPFADVEKWIAKQPDYLQPGFAHVMERGTVEQVKDLVARFYQSTGQKMPSAAPDPVKVAADAAVAATRTKAAAALAPVANKRTGAVAAAEPTDFDGGFAAAMVSLAADDKFTR